DDALPPAVALARDPPPPSPRRSPGNVGQDDRPLRRRTRRAARGVRGLGGGAVRGARRLRGAIGARASRPLAAARLGPRYRCTSTAGRDARRLAGETPARLTPAACSHPYRKIV